MAQDEPRGGLLGLDLGLRMGLAYYASDGKLERYHAQHFANRAALKRQVYATLMPWRPLDVVIMEGDKALAEIWRKLPEKWGAEVHCIQAHAWREALLLPRQRDHGGSKAKRHAQDLALEVIAWSGAARPKGTLKHDAAEAILIGAWGCKARGWLDGYEDLPAFLRHGA